METRILGSTVAAAALAIACAQWSLVPAQKRSLGGVYSVHPQVEWSRSEGGSSELWTIHGPWLETVVLSFVADGMPLLGSEDDELADLRFDAGMSAQELAGLLAQALTRLGSSDVRMEGVRPAEFGGRNGFRFDIHMADELGLERTGLAQGAVVEGRLCMVAFWAPRGHYYERYGEIVERMIDSASFP